MSNEQEAIRVLRQEAESRKQEFIKGYQELEEKYGFTVGISQILTLHGSVPNQAQILPIPNWSPKDARPDIDIDNP